jgi:Zn finger protein HypA/HybF involved in hydrogenase expression
MNPPYGRTIGKWVRKAWVSSKQGATVVCLVPARTDTRWWHDYAMKGEILCLPGRLKFGDSKNSAPFPSAIVTFWPKDKIAVPPFTSRANVAPAKRHVREIRKRTVCAHCGKQPVHFHHPEVDGNNQNRVSALVAYGATTERIDEEIARCIPLCPSCHSKEHARLAKEAGEKLKQIAPAKRYIRLCVVCDGVFAAERSDAETCSGACRVRLHRQRRENVGRQAA